MKEEQEYAKDGTDRRHQEDEPERIGKHDRQGSGHRLEDSPEKYADKDDFNEAVEKKVKERHSKLDPYKPIIEGMLEKEEQ